MRELKLRHVLRAFVFRIAGQHALFPGHLIQIAIGQNQDDQTRVAPFFPVMRNGDDLIDAVHQHRAVTDRGDHHAVREGKLRGDGVRHARSHRGQISRERCHHAAAHLQIARKPVRGGAGVGHDDAIVRQSRREFPKDALRIDRLGFVHRARLQNFPPFRHAVFDLLAPLPILFASKQRFEGAQCFRAVADQIHFRRIANAQHFGIDVDLHAASLTFLGQKFRIRKTRTDNEQRVALGHQVPARLRAEQTNRADAEREIVRYDGFA